MALTNFQLKNIQPKEKDYFISDEKGLRLLVKPSGAMYWRLKYRFSQKQKTLAIGVYPEVGLKEARDARDEARRKIAEGFDPGLEKQEYKRHQLLREGDRFSILAEDWWEQQKGAWKEHYAERVWIRLRDNSFKELDKKPYNQIVPQDIIYVVRIVESREALDVASRVLMDIKRVFRYGVQMGKLESNPASELSGILKARKTYHRPSMPNDQLGRFMLELSNYMKTGQIQTQLAVQMLAYTFSRPGEVRGAEWKEFDFEASLWRVPAERMKMGTEHLIPLSKQVLLVLEQLKPLTGHRQYLFPSTKDPKQPISDNTMRAAMFRLGYDGKTDGKAKATPHGFRANATSILNEKGFNPDAIERQLSHMERNSVRAAYIHHARYMDDRVEIMQWWADYLDGEAAKYSK